MTEENPDRDQPGQTEPLTDIELRTVLQSCTSPEWPVERLLILRREWDKGTSTNRIGDVLGTTKSAVIGKSHRLLALGALTPRKANPGGGWSQGRTRRNLQDGAEALKKARAASRRESGTTTGYQRGAAQLVHAQKIAAAPPVPIPTLPAPAPVPRLLPIVLNTPLASAPRPAAPRPAPRAPAVPDPIAEIPVSPPPKYGRVIECCWPLGDPGTRAFRTCDDPSLPGRPYCEPHAGKAYMRVRGSASPMAGTGSLLGAP